MLTETQIDISKRFRGSRLHRRSKQTQYAEPRCIADRCLPASILSRSVTALGLLLTISSSAIALEPHGAPWTEAARKASLDDPRMLQAIAFAESGRTDDHGRIEPWPWALNIDGQAFFPTSQDEAMALLSVHQDRSVDVGLLQINIRWHGHRVDDPKSLLDPATNLEIGAAILKEALASAPGDLTAGIGRYHSSDPERARSYARTVLAFYRYLIHGDEEMRDARS
ncbi:MAG: lytic transglycosylase domain-containing protein [Alphaproteobacteria bacterium]